MLNWFKNLAPGEQVAALAIVEDATFIKFYMDVYAQENKNRGPDSVNNHTLFNRDYLCRMFDTAKAALKKNKSITAKKTLSNDSASTSITNFPPDSLRDPFTRDENLMCEYETGEFDDPFSAKNISSNRPLPDLLSKRSGNIISAFAHECVDNIVKISVQRASGKINYCAYQEHHVISDRLHKDIVLAMSNGTEWDSLFFITDDYSKTMKTFQILSSYRIFDKIPTQSEVKVWLNGKSLPDPKWIEYPVPSFTILLARIEASLWSAFYACGGVIENPDPYRYITHAELAAKLKIKAASGNASTTSVVTKDAPLKSLNQSPLGKLHASATMFTLGCAAEELKSFWCRLGEDSKESILASLPLARAYLAELNRCGCRSEGVVDRLILCPLDWAFEIPVTTLLNVIENMKDMKANLMAQMLLDELNDNNSRKPTNSSPNNSALKHNNPYISSNGQSYNNGKQISTVPSPILANKGFPHVAYLPSDNISNYSKFVSQTAMTSLRSRLHPNQPSHTVTVKPVINQSTSSMLADEKSAFSFHFNHLDPSVDTESKLKITDKIEEINANHTNSLTTTAAKRKNKNKKKKKKSKSATSETEADAEVIDGDNEVNDADVVVTPELTPTEDDTDTAAHIESEVNGSKSSTLSQATDSISVTAHSSNSDKPSEVEWNLKPIHYAETEVNTNTVFQDDFVTVQHKKSSKVQNKPLQTPSHSSNSSGHNRGNSQQQQQLQQSSKPNGRNHSHDEVLPHTTDLVHSSSSQLCSNQQLRHAAQSSNKSNGHKSTTNQQGVTSNIINQIKESKHENNKCVNENSAPKVPTSTPPSINVWNKKVVDPTAHPISKSCDLKGNSSSTHMVASASVEVLKTGKDKQLRKVIPDSSSNIPVAVVQINSIPEEVRIQKSLQEQRILNEKVMGEEMIRRGKEDLVAELESLRIRRQNCDEADRLMEEERSRQVAIIESHLQKTMEERRLSSERAIREMEAERLRRIQEIESARAINEQEELRERQENLKYVTELAEQERLRRMNEIESCQLLDDEERKVRQNWAESQLKQEQQSRIDLSDSAMIMLQRRLTKNIKNFNKVMIHRMAIHTMCQYAVFQEVQSIAATIWPHATVRVYGSSLTGLALPSSDIDVVIQLVPHPEEHLYQVSQMASIFNMPFNPTNFGLNRYQCPQYGLPISTSPGFIPQSLGIPLSFNNINSQQFWSPPHGQQTPTSEITYQSHQYMTERTADQSECGSTSHEVISSSAVEEDARSNAGDEDANEYLQHMSTQSTSRNSSRPHSARFSSESLSADNGMPTNQTTQTILVSASNEFIIPDAPESQTQEIVRPGFMFMPQNEEQQYGALPSSELVIQGLYTLAGELHKLKWATAVNPIPTASIPVIKLNAHAEALLSTPGLLQAQMMYHQQQLSQHQQLQLQHQHQQQQHHLHQHQQQHHQQQQIYKSKYSVQNGSPADQFGAPGGGMTSRYPNNGQVGMNWNSPSNNQQPSPNNRQYGMPPPNPFTQPPLYQQQQQSRPYLQQQPQQNGSYPNSNIVKNSYFSNGNYSAQSMSYRGPGSNSPSSQQMQYTKDDTTRSSIQSSFTKSRSNSIQNRDQTSVHRDDLSQTEDNFSVVEESVSRKSDKSSGSSKKKQNSQQTHPNVNPLTLQNQQNQQYSQAGPPNHQHQQYQQHHTPLNTQGHQMKQVIQNVQSSSGVSEAGNSDETATVVASTPKRALTKNDKKKLKQIQNQSQNSQTQNSSVQSDQNNLNFPDVQNDIVHVSAPALENVSILLDAPTEIHKVESSNEDKRKSPVFDVRSSPLSPTSQKQKSTALFVKTSPQDLTTHTSTSQATPDRSNYSQYNNAPGSNPVQIPEFQTPITTSTVEFPNFQSMQQYPQAVTYAQLLAPVNTSVNYSDGHYPHMTNIHQIPPNSNGGYYNPNDPSTYPATYSLQFNSRPPQLVYTPSGPMMDPSYNIVNASQMPIAPVLTTSTDGQYSTMYQPRTPQAAYLPYQHAISQAKGLVIPVDITIESGEHKGISTCEYIVNVIRSRARALPLVVKVVKNLLVNAGLNVPFSGGLSGYSVFLMVCAAYEQCQVEDEAATNVLSLAERPSQYLPIDNVVSVESALSTSSVGRTLPIDTDSLAVPTVSLKQATGVTSSDTNKDNISGKINDGSHAASSLIDESWQRERSESASTISQTHSRRAQIGITEGRLFLHFLKLFGREFDPMKQGIDMYGKQPIFFDLNAEQIATVGTSCWIKDPLDPTKNVARPSYAFKQIQQLFSQCLSELEKEHLQLYRTQYISGTSVTVPAAPLSPNGNSPSHSKSHFKYNSHANQERESGSSSGPTNHYNNQYSNRPGYNSSHSHSFSNNPIHNNNFGHRNNWSNNSNSTNRGYQGGHNHGHYRDGYQGTNRPRNQIHGSNAGRTISNPIIATRITGNQDEPDLLRSMMRY